MPAKPVLTLSFTPSSREVITTMAKTPSINMVKVRIESRLCDKSWIRPPVMPSPMREAWTKIPFLFIAQGLHRRLPAGLQSGIESEQEAEDDRQEKRPEEAQGCERQRHADHAG